MLILKIILFAILSLNMLYASEFKIKYLSCTLNKTKKVNGKWEDVPLRIAKTKNEFEQHLTISESKVNGFAFGKYKKTIDKIDVYVGNHNTIYINTEKINNILVSYNRWEEKGTYDNYICKTRSQTIEERAKKLEKKFTDFFN